MKHENTKREGVGGCSNLKETLALRQRNTVRCNVQNFQANRNLLRCVPRNVLKCLMKGKNCRTAGENDSDMMAMEMTFAHIGLFKHKYWNIRFST